MECDANQAWSSHLIEPDTVILFIGDEMYSREIKRMFIKGNENLFNIIHAGDMSEGIQLLRNRGSDLVVYDIGGRGKAALDDIENLQQMHPRVPVILLTDSEDKNVGIEAVSRGCQDYLVKNKLDPYLFVCSVHYAIERNRAETALGDSIGEWHATFDAIRDMIVLIDLDGNILKCNRALSDTVGRPCEKIVESNYFDLFDPHSRELMQQQVARVRSAAGRASEIFTIGEKWYEITLDPLIRSGALKGIVCVMSDITGRKQMQDRLMQYKLMVESAHDAIFYKDRESRYIIANNETVRAFGLPREKVIGRNDLQLMPDREEAAKNIKDDRKVLSTGRPVKVEKHMTGADGKEYWFNAVKVPHIDAQGNIKGIIGIARDISGQKRIEKTLKESEKKYRELVEGINDFVISIGPDGRILFMNSAFYTGLGYTDAEICGRPVFDIISQAHQETCREMFNAVICGEDVDCPGMEFITKDGRTIHVNGTVTCQSDRGKPVAVYGVFRDITENVEIKKALDETEKKYQNLVELANDGIAIIQDGAVKFLNTRLAQMWGGEAEQAVNTPFIQYIDPDEQEKVSSYYRDRMAGKDVPNVYETTIRDINGNSIYAELNTRVIQYENKPADLVVVRDITGRKKAEQERSKLQEQLQQSQKMEAVGTLAGGIAHDFNNILTVISGTLDLIMLKNGEQGPMATDLKQIRDAAKRAADLTRQLLLYSRKQHMELSELDLNKTISSLLNMLKRLIGEDVSIQTGLESGLWAVKGDKGNIEQMLMNLVINARDAINNGGEISLTAENVIISRESETRIPETCSYGKYVKIAVKDTGMGMSRETQEHMFDPFYTTKGQGKGTGLGMSVVYGIVKEHGGWIDVQSEPGEGTEISAYFPALDSRTRRKESDAEKTAIVDLKGHGERILLVEDEDSVRWTTKSILEENGYSVVVASNAGQACEIMRQEEGGFALVFTDVILPDNNGLELVEMLKNIRSDINFLLSSGYTGDKTQSHLIKEKEYPFIQKPYELNELLMLIKDCINES